MFSFNKETMCLAGVVIAFLGLVYLFREIRKLRQLVSTQPSVAPVREAPKMVPVRKPVAPPPIQKARIVEDDDESSEEEEG